jgi:uncharacterized protein (TIGR00106 family)
MSVLMQFAIFPTDKGTSVSEYVSRVIEMVKQSGFNYKLGPMGTAVETETFADALEILQKSHDILGPDSERIYASINFDIKKGQSGRLEKKIESIEKKIGPVKK